MSTSALQDFKISIRQGRFPNAAITLKNLDSSNVDNFLTQVVLIGKGVGFEFTKDEVRSSIEDVISIGTDPTVTDVDSAIQRYVALNPEALW